MDIGGAYMSALRFIETQPERFAANHDMQDIVASGFDLVSEPLLQATHVVCTEVDLFEWGDSDTDMFDFILEIATSRFGYEE
jgi:hypothetical protein